YLLTYVCYNETRHSIERNRIALYEMVAENTAVNMDLLFTNYKNLSKFIALDRHVQQAAAAESPVDPALTYTITDMLLSNPFNLSGLNNVGVYGADGASICSLIEAFAQPGGRNLNELIPHFQELNMYGYLYWSDTSRYSLNNNKF